ncbi:hypothetical protein C8J57DRAFT_1532188 [Mycena rebaudengoi]|nr:hypothetical protein C8J57DRAFT_1532188 [Mycena rebaudengoi]
MTAQSAEYAAILNSRIDEIQTALDDRALTWVNSASEALNSTIVNTYSDIQQVIDDIFGGTILATPIQQFLQCILGSKIDEVENILTFLHNNLIIRVPRLDSSALLISSEATHEIVRAVAGAAVGESHIDEG